MSMRPRATTLELRHLALFVGVGHLAQHHPWNKEFECLPAAGAEQRLGRVLSQVPVAPHNHA